MRANKHVVPLLVTLYDPLSGILGGEGGVGAEVVDNTSLDKLGRSVTAVTA